MDVPEGYERVWVRDDQWVVLAEHERAGRYCRWGAKPGRAACSRPAIALLRRRHGAGHRWWAYCAEHLYGRRIRDGRVEIDILREVREPAAPADGRAR
jgi:hypothetical protein